MTPQSHLKQYLQKMREIRAMATPETSYYPALGELLDGIGGELKPKVKSVAQPGGTGQGIPDFGLYTDTQIKRMRGGNESEKPARGAVEAKPLSQPLADLLRSEQTEKYARSCGVVLAVNYREFALAELQNGKIKIIARCQIAADETEFWQKAETPQKTAEECGVAVCEFLRRALSHNAQILNAEDVARNLASFARESLAILENNKNESALASLRADLESALGMAFTGKHGEHFFRSTLAQTIFYGLFSAWLETEKTFNWKQAQYSVRTPVMKSLFAAILAPDQLGGIKNLQHSLDGAEEMLNRVEDKGRIFGGMETTAAILHFYEPFLAAFDPKLREEMGVWYTPPEIVRYMVERADRVLRTELKIADGLADKNVYVLDPCGGTGAYIAEVLRRIYKTCKERGDGAAAAQIVKEAAKTRIIGFEILSASYIIAHWQIGALLKELGAPLAEDERAAVYLTNSLTNWTPAEQPHLNLPGLEEERNAANKIKQEKPILVILGNPPYNAFAGTSPKEEKNLVASYKEGLNKKWGIKKFNLDDLYVRFFRMAENRIAKTGRGIVSFISNYSYTEEPSFVVMREKLLKNFDKLWIENMHGNRKQSEFAPDGNSSETVFAMHGFSSGIQQGVVIALMLKTSDSEEAAKVQYHDNIDAAKANKRRAQLLESLNASDFDSQYAIANPQEWNKFSFYPLNVSDIFLHWTAINEFYEFDSDGLMEKRGGALISIDSPPLENRMRDYFNPAIDWETYRKKGGGLAKDAAEFNAEKTRKNALTRQFNDSNIANYTMRPFDNGYCYYSGIRPIWNRNRPKLWKQYKPGNFFIISRAKNSNANEGAPVFFTSCLGDNAALGLARYIPFHFYKEEKNLAKTTITKTANLSEKARAYLQTLNFPNPDENETAAEIIWLHALAVCYSPNYQTENADGLKIGWPRIPLPKDAATLKKSAAIGKKIRNLLDMQTPLNWQTPEGKKITTLATLSGDEKDLSDLSVADWWGYKDRRGRVNPGKGKIENTPPPPSGDPSAGQFRQKLGAMIAVKLNGKLKWENIPERAWNYRIGGFQPPKKWLSYRAAKIINRALKPEETRTFSDIIRRLSALILLEEELNKNYAAVKKTAEKVNKE